MKPDNNLKTWLADDAVKAWLAAVLRLPQSAQQVAAAFAMGFELGQQKRKSKGGRPKLWPPERYLRLAEDVRELMAKNSRLTEAAACARLAGKGAYRDLARSTLHRRLMSHREVLRVMVEAEPRPLPSR